MAKRIKIKAAKSEAGPQHTAVEAQSGENRPAVLGEEAKVLAAMFSEGRFNETEEHARGLLKQHPGWAYGWNILGVCCGMRKKYEEAIDAFTRALHLQPDDAEIHVNIGYTLRQQGKPEEAIGHYRRALELAPDFAEGHNNLGVMLRGQGNLADAVESYRRAIEIRPGYAEAHSNLGNALREQGNLAGAVESYRRAVEIKPGYAEAHSSLGSALRGQGNLAEAVESYRRAIEIKPGYAEAHSGLGNVLRDQGNLAEAMESYQKALELNPSYAKAYENYSRCRKFTPDDKPLADRLETLLGEAHNEDDRCSLHFALGKIYGDFGRYDESFQHYLKGNRLERIKYSYDPEVFSSFVDRLIRTFSADFFRGKKPAGSSSELPVFILGMPRSGTTLIEQIISSHPLVHGAGELLHMENIIREMQAVKRRPYPECAEDLGPDDAVTMSGSYLDLLKGGSAGLLRITDKMPGNFLHLGLISLLFPNARVVHCRRNPLDTCLSIFFQRFIIHHAYSFDLRELGRYYLDYERLMEHWRAVLPPGMMLEVQYEEVVERPEELSRQLVEFCGLPWDDRCLRFHENDRAVKTASSWQVRQPVYKTSREKWRRYEKHLGPLIEALSGGNTGDGGEAERLIRTALERYSTGEEADRLIREVLKTEKDTADTLHILGAKELQKDNFDGAEKLIRHAIKINNTSAAYFHNLGTALMKQGRLDESIASYVKALELKPEYSEAHNSLGRVFIAQGKPAEAIESYRRALDLNPGLAEAYRNYAACVTFTAEDGAFADRLEELLKIAKSDEDRSNCHFALGKIYSDCGYYDKAFLHYQSGNLLDGKKYSYDWRRFSANIDRLKKTFSADLFRNRIWAGSPSELPVFVLGMPRSGTTLIEQIISSHALVFGAGELEYFNNKCNLLAAELRLPYPEFIEILSTEDLEGIAAEYIEYLRGLSNSAIRITDKLPANFLHLGLIALLFRNARVVHCRRNPVDTCLSIYFQKFTGSHPYSFDLRDLGHYYRDYERLMEHWRAVLPQGMMLEVQYEEVVERPEETSRKLIEFCGLEWDDLCLKSHENSRVVRTASSWQVRQPIYKTSKEKWRRYEKHLGPLIEALSGTDVQLK